MYQVYVWTHKKEGKRYVGVTRQDTILKRAAYGDGYRGSPAFYRALKADGLDAFTAEVVAVTDSIGRAHELEEMFIDRYDTRNPEYGYNVFHSGYPTMDAITAERNAKISDTLKHQRGESGYRELMSRRMKRVWDDPGRRASMIEKRHRANRPGGMPRIKVHIVEIDKTFDNKIAATRYLGLSRTALSCMPNNKKVCRSKVDGNVYTVEIVSE